METSPEGKKTSFEIAREGLETMCKDDARAKAEATLTPAESTLMRLVEDGSIPNFELSKFRNDEEYRSGVNLRFLQLLVEAKLFSPFDHELFMRDSEYRAALKTRYASELERIFP